MKDNLEQNIIINNQLLPNNITNESVLELFRSINKEIFVDDVDKSLANIDENFFFNEKRFMLKNSTIGKLLDLIIDKKYSNSLNIGSGTGFSSVLLSQISDYVVSLESDKSLHEKEKKNIKLLEIKNIRTINKDLKTGYKDSMPYDLIFVNGCLKDNKNIFLEQLSNYGRLVCIELINKDIKRIVRYIKNNKFFNRKEFYIVNSPILL